MSARTRIKFCGMTSAEEIGLAVEAGADAVGVILAESPRRVPLDALPALGRAVPPFVAKVAVVVDPGDEELETAVRHGFTVQFSGSESPARCAAAGRFGPYVKVFHVESDQRFDATTTSPRSRRSRARCGNSKPASTGSRAGAAFRSRGGSSSRWPARGGSSFRAASRRRTSANA